MGQIWTSLTHGKVRRTSNRSEIKSILRNNKSITNFHNGILIGSRAARSFLPNFRETTVDNDADWDIIISSKILVAWLCNHADAVSSVEMVIPTSDDHKHLDLYVYCILNDQSKYDFAVPRSSKSYTAYLLNNAESWIDRSFKRTPWLREYLVFEVASAKLLLILKKYMLYYPHQWEKTAKDYRQLLAVADPLTDHDTVLCHLFVHYNETMHGKRSLDIDEFIITPSNAKEGKTIIREQFFLLDKDNQVSFMYQTAMSLSIAGDILIGLEHICTQGPPWLADYVINNWLAIQNEKFKQKFQLLHPCLEFEVDNHRLFPEIPEIALQQILHYLTDTADFYSMHLICKRWYTIMRQEAFWRDLYLSRYGEYSNNADNIKSWKMLYFIRLEGHITDESKFEQLVDATIRLRQWTANDVLQLWEDLTYENQPIEPVVLSKINNILSNSFYYHMGKTSDHYSVQLVIIGLEDVRSRSNVDLKLSVGNCGSSRFTDHMEELQIKCNLNESKQHLLKFFATNFLGLNVGKWVYTPTKSTLLAQSTSSLYSQFPSGLLLCLLITMVHPDHCAQFIQYLKNLNNQCIRGRSPMGF